MSEPRAARPVRLTTERFLLRSCVPADASDHWIAWAADPEVMTPLNASVTTLTREFLAQFIAGFDNRNRFLIGIFTRDTDLHIGFHTLLVDHAHGLLNVSVLIGDKAWWGNKVVLETRAALLDYFFAEMNIEKAIGNPIARNYPAIYNYKAQGWTLEGIFKRHARSPHDGSRLDQYQFAMLREDWQRQRRAG